MWLWKWCKSKTPKIEIRLILYYIDLYLNIMKEMLQNSREVSNAMIVLLS